MSKLNLNFCCLSPFICYSDEAYFISISVSFWSKVKRFIKPSSSSLVGFISSSNQVVKDSMSMCDIAADFYQDFFRKSDDIVRPHPYVDAPCIDFDNHDVDIPAVSLEELLRTVNEMKKKKSIDAHGLNNFMFNFLHSSHWSLFLHLSFYLLGKILEFYF